VKIVNKTDYSTRHLRKIFLACEKNEGTDYKSREVKVIYTRGGATSGYAWYNSNSVVMKLPKPKMQYNNLASIHRVARVYIHEVGHNLNLRHKEMMRWWDIEIDFLEEGRVEFKLVTLKPVISKPKKEAVKKIKKSAAEKNEEKARKKLAEWEKKLSRSKTFVKKYQKKVKYYDKKKEMVV
jgi:hypothetical protein